MEPTPSSSTDLQGIESQQKRYGRDDEAYTHIPPNTDSDCLGWIAASCCAIGAALCVKGATDRRNRAASLRWLWLLLAGFFFMLLATACIVLYFVFLSNPHAAKERQVYDVLEFFDPQNSTQTGQ